jgi:hypothetical protein
VVTGAPPCHGLFAAGGVFPAAGHVVVVHALPSRFHARERAARHATWCPAPHTSTTAWDPPHRHAGGVFRAVRTRSRLAVYEVVYEHTF